MPRAPFFTPRMLLRARPQTAPHQSATQSLLILANCIYAGPHMQALMLGGSPELRRKPSWCPTANCADLCCCQRRIKYIRNRGAFFQICSIYKVCSRGRACKQTTLGDNEMIKHNIDEFQALATTQTPSSSCRLRSRRRGIAWTALATAGFGS